MILHIFDLYYALKAPETKRQYPKRLEVFLDYLKLEGNSIEEKVKIGSMNLL